MRVLALVLLSLVMLLQYRLWVSDNGMREVWRLRREVAAQSDTNAGLKDRNRTLAAEVQDLKKGKSAIEERARTDLGMVGSNETFFQVASATQPVMTPGVVNDKHALQVAGNDQAKPVTERRTTQQTHAAGSNLPNTVAAH